MKYGVATTSEVEAHPYSVYVFTLRKDPFGEWRRWFDTPKEAVLALEGYLSYESDGEDTDVDGFTVVRIPDHMVDTNFTSEVPYQDQNPANIDVSVKGRVLGPAFPWLHKEDELDKVVTAGYTKQTTHDNQLF